jgi:Protein of unknown function (DUF2637)
MSLATTEERSPVTSTGPPLTLPLSASAIAHDKWLSRFRTILVVLLGCAVSGIGCLAFYTSFEAIKAYAERSSGIAPGHAWAIPLLVDSFIVVATGADLWFTTTKQQRRLWEIWWPKALLAGAAGVSFILNVAHAESGNWAARGVAAIPPAALVLGVELLMMVLRRATTIRSARLQAELDKQQLELAALQAPPPPPVRGEITRKQRRQRREMPSSSAEAAAEDEQEQQQEPPQPEDADRDPNVPIFTPAMPGRADDKRHAARTAAARAAAAAAPAKTAVPARSKPVTEHVTPAAAHAAEPVFNAARLRGDKRPGALDRNGKPLTPYVVAARILDEREAKESLTPEALVQALADEGLNVNAATAQELLRELRPPLPSRISSQRPGATGDGRSPVDGRAVVGLTSKAKNRG